jgi:hypothetical protein
MDELINQITSRTGISEDQARQVVEMVFSFAKDKLPEPIASYLDGLIGAGDAPEGMLEQLQGQMGNLGGLFGK